MTDRWMDDRCSDRQMHGKILLLSHKWADNEQTGAQKNNVARSVV